MRIGKTYTTETVIRRSKKDEGFTLIEVIVAISIFAIGLLAVAAMQTSAIRVNSSAARLTELNTWGMDKLEQLMALPYTDPQLQAAGSPFQETTSDGYNVTWNVINNSPVQNSTLIRITVAGKGKTLRLVSIRSQSL